MRVAGYQHPSRNIISTVVDLRFLISVPKISTYKLFQWALDVIRTHDPLLTRQVLWPTELRKANFPIFQTTKKPRTLSEASWIYFWFTLIRIKDRKPHTTILPGCAFPHFINGYDVSELHLFYLYDKDNAKVSIYKNYFKKIFVARKL